MQQTKCKCGREIDHEERAAKLSEAVRRVQALSVDKQANAVGFLLAHANLAAGALRGLCVYCAPTSNG